MLEEKNVSALETAETVDVPEKAPKAVKTEKKAVKEGKKKKEKKERKHPFREMFAELKKVTWPSKHDLRVYTTSVIVFVVVFTLILWVIDFGVSAFTQFISDSSKLPTILNGWFGIGG